VVDQPAALADLADPASEQDYTYYNLFIDAIVEKTYIITLTRCCILLRFESLMPDASTYLKV